MSLRSIELREKRAKIVHDAQTVFSALETPTAEDNAKFDAAMVSSDALMAQIAREERSEEVARELAASAAERRDDHAGVILTVDPKEQAALEKRFMTATLRQRAGIDLNEADKKLVATFRNTAMSTGTQGVEMIAPLFQRELLIAMKAQGGMRAAARVIQTDTGASLPWPTMDDTAQSASIITENSAITEDTELTFNTVTVGAFTYKSGVLLISLQLLQDSAFDFDSIIRDALASRFVRKQNADFTTGAGTTLPFGVVTKASSGKVGTTGQTLTVIYDDLVDLFHSVDPVYRAGASWMMADSSIQVIRKLKDSQGHPLWQPSLTVGAPDSLLGLPIVVNQNVAAMAANAKSILFGNFQNYLIRDTLEMSWLVLKELYAANLQVGYIAFMRSDGNLISAAAPIKYYANSAT